MEAWYMTYVTRVIITREAIAAAPRGDWLLIAVVLELTFLLLPPAPPPRWFMLAPSFGELAAVPVCAGIGWSISQPVAEGPVDTDGVVS